MHCDSSRSSDSWLAPVQVLTHYSNVLPIDERSAEPGGGGRSSASGRAGDGGRVNNTQLIALSLVPEKKNIVTDKLKRHKDQSNNMILNW